MLVSKECLWFTVKTFTVILLFAVILGALSLWLHFALYTFEHAAVAEVTPALAFVLDAGHGGRDGGAVGINGVMEKDLNLSIAAVLRDYMVLCGAEIIMTRTEDSLVCDEADPALKGKLKQTDLKNRLALAQAGVPAVFVSIHMNKFSIEKYKGLQVYYSPNDEQSAGYAKRVQNRIQCILQPENTRKTKAAGSSIFLLDRLNSPAILIECGFLSNREDAQNLSDAAYRARLSVVIADSLLVN